MNNEIFEFPDGIDLRPVHPGEILADELEFIGVSTHAFAIKAGVDPQQIDDLAHGKCAVTESLADGIGRYFDMGAGFWLRLQKQYDEAIARKRGGT